MTSVINTNIASLNAQRNLNSSQSSLQTSLQRLSSGLRINSAKDDAAGLAISQRMTAQINGSNQAARNANDGISLAQTAEGDLVQVGNNLQRMRELAVQSANASNSASDRAALDQEFQALSTEIDRVAKSSSFNGVNLLDGSFQSKTFQVGANATANDQITVSSIASARTSSLGTFNGFSTNLAVANGTAGPLSVTVGTQTLTTTSAVATDAKDIAAAINNFNADGLTATARATTVTNTQTNAVSAAGTDSFTLNGVNISVGATTNASTNRSNAVAAINAQSSVTGVIATDTGTGLKLDAADGRNIAISGFTAGTGTTGTLASYGLAAGTTNSTVDVKYTAPAGTAVTSVAFSGAGTSATATVGPTGASISSIDIKSAANSTSALASLDAALSSVNTSRASLGALQNRFTSVVSSLQTSSENLSASRSRIQDTDFAAESANMTRNQILQQAGTAMLAQANQLPNSVMSLLR